MTDVVLTNAVLFTGTSEAAMENSAVWVEGDRIAYAGPAEDLPAAAPATHKDVAGAFIMPGMTESHTHLSFLDKGPFDLGQPSAEEAMLGAVRNARVMLGAGFTSAISFGCVHNVDVVLRDAIEAGSIPGPRLRAGGRDIGTTASNVDSPGGLSMIADGPWDLRKLVRKQRHDRVEIVKIFLDGEGVNPHAPPGELSFADEEVEAVVDEAHRHGMRVACHARSAAAVKQAVRYGVDLIGHANYLDDEALQMLKDARDRLFVGPAIAWEITFLDNLEDFGFPSDGFHANHYRGEVEATVNAMARLEDAGVRTLIGGDYGISIAPHGAYATDLEYFVDLFGMTPGRALLCATRDGGAAADPTGQRGTLEEGKLADLVIVDGNPLEDITILQDHARIPAVMKGGVFYRDLTSPDPFRTHADALFADHKVSVLEPAQ